MKFTFTFLFAFISILVSIPLYSQNKATISGKVIDSKTSEIMSYASIRVLDAKTDKLITGGITTEKGTFSLQVPYGIYVVAAEFMGYKIWKSDILTLDKSNAAINLGTILLQTQSQQLTEVEVRAEKSTMEMALDKRVFNVGKDLANAGGTASDILTNIPSVSVEPDGGIKLRGSDNVRILIDGKPSGLVSFKGGAGLQSLQASMIERVEVITNPSARYEAEGMAGIINIVLKKDKKQGFNGSFDVITGYPVNEGLGINMNYRHQKLNFFLNYGIAYRITPNIAHNFQQVFNGDTTVISDQDRNGNLKGFNNNIQGGLDYFFSEKSFLTASYLFRRSDARRITDLVYKDYVNSLNNLIRTTYRQQDEKETEPNSEYALTYRRDFDKKNHSFSAEVRYIDNWERSDQLFTQNAFKPNGSVDKAQTLLQNSLNDEYEKQWLFQTDYSKPIHKDGKVEVGARANFRDMVNDYVVNQQNENGVFVPLPGLKNYFIYTENINAVYGIVGDKYKKLSYQIGLRAEWTNVKTTLRETNEVNPRNYSNLFPSAHIAWEIPNENSLQLSFSRRVRRPFYNDLSPFATFSDSRNFFGGNPNLNPEFTNAFEIGHIKYFKFGSLSSSLFYRDTKDKIQTIRSVNDLGFATTRPENLTGEKSFGLDIASQVNFYQWWKSDFSFSIFNADMDGSNIDENYKRNTQSWFARHTSKFSLPNRLDIQVRANYEAPQKTVQGRRLSMYYIDFSVSKEVFQGKGTLNLNIIDIFNTRVSRFVTEGANFITDGSSQFRRRQINLTLNYRIKNAKKVKSIISDETN
ncbi:TonB-dependent receptor domain-containing protein [Flectobacillus longus]|uniref:TonB-dependent receptor domain-containing protein n=1 Tax=Flectobacillus longus TaxID=2984207 RepID=UPI0024B673A9|nr:TonB-dependent receptor [Flectobacillus longus]MDI9880608.1 TonB-dependent receptor [Flectobacillus longus]